MMKLKQSYKSIFIKAIFSAFFFMVLVFLNLSANAQEHPPRPMQVSTFQNLSFGAILQGTTGGNIIIDPQGSRSVTGDIIPVNMGFSYFPAIFEVEANPGSLITIVNGPDVTLNGSNGGTITLHVGSSLPTSPFVNTKSPPFRTQIRVGGTLIISNSLANPAGNYFGTFSITFAQQ